MEINREKYVARGIPKIDLSFIEAQTRTPKKETDYSSFRQENPHLSAVLDYRSAKVAKNMPAKSLTMIFDDVAGMTEREFKLRASLLYQGLFFGSEEGAELSEESGLPILTEEMGENWEKIYHNIRKLRPDSSEFLEFLRNKDLRLFDLISRMSSEYPLSKPPVAGREFDMRDANSIIAFMNERGNLGAEIIYNLLRKKNQAIKLEEQFNQ